MNPDDIRRSIILDRLVRFRDKWTSNLWSNPQMTLDLLELSSRALGCDPDYKALSRNPNVTIDFVKQTLDKAWSWSELTRNPAIKLLDILANKDLPWDDFWVQKKPGITMSIVREHNDMQWDFARLSAVMPFQEILENPELPWCYSSMSFNASAPMEYVLEHRELPWEWLGVSCHIVKNLEIVLQHPDAPWSWYGLSCNKHLTIEDVLEHPENPWSIPKTPGAGMWRRLLQGSYHQAGTGPSGATMVLGRLVLQSESRCRRHHGVRSSPV